MKVLLWVSLTVVLAASSVFGKDEGSIKFLRRKGRDLQQAKDPRSWNTPQEFPVFGGLPLEPGNIRNTFDGPPLVFPPRQISIPWSRDEIPDLRLPFPRRIIEDQEFDISVRPSIYQVPQPPGRPIINQDFLTPEVAIIAQEPVKPIPPHGFYPNMNPLLEPPGSINLQPVLDPGYSYPQWPISGPGRIQPQQPNFNINQRPTMPARNNSPNIPAFSIPERPITNRNYNLSDYPNSDRGIVGHDRPIVPSESRIPRIRDRNPESELSKNPLDKFNGNNSYSRNDLKPATKIPAVTALEVDDLLATTQNERTSTERSTKLKLYLKESNI